MPKLTIQLVVWNGAKYLPFLFESLKKQTFKDFELLILDNGSKDESVQVIEDNLNSFKNATLSKKLMNLGFAGGHNNLFKKGTAEYILLLNQDMYLKEDCLELLVKYLDSNSEVSSISPRLMKWDFAPLHDLVSIGSLSRESEKYKEMLKLSFTDKVDTLGLRVSRSRRVVDQYTARSWQDVYSEVRNDLVDSALPVFGNSGALPMLRRSALEEVKFEDGNFFDESYGSYKEDVDLAFRMHSAGFNAAVLVDSIAYHDRSAAGPLTMDDFTAADNKKKQPDYVAIQSYKNQLITIRKNEYFVNFLIDLTHIFFYELKKFVWFAIFNRKVLKGALSWTKSEYRDKRRYIKGKRKRSAREMRAWFI